MLLQLYASPRNQAVDSSMYVKFYVNRSGRCFVFLIQGGTIFPRYIRSISCCAPASSYTERYFTGYAQHHGNSINLCYRWSSKPAKSMNNSSYRVLHKNWDKLCLRIMACYKEWTFTFWVHWPPVVILFWWHQQKKTEESTSVGCFAEFLLGVWNCSLYKFPDFLEKRFCHRSLSCQFFATSHLYTLPATPTTKYFLMEAFRRGWGTFGVLTPLTFGENIPTQHPAVCSLLLPLLWESGYECVGFSLH